MDPRLPTVEETPPEQRTAALLPVDKLKQLCHEQNKHRIQEFRLKGMAESLKDFLDVCFLENGEYVKNRIVWISENSFVRLGDGFVLPRDYHYRRFGLRLWATDDGVYSYDHDLRIHSSTVEEAIAALDLLAGLQDTYFKGIKLEYYGGRNRICPLRGRHLEIFVRNANQCRILATSGIRTNIGFWNCSFEDGGIAFVEASASRENQESGPAKLSIFQMLLFGGRNFSLFLSQHRLESLKLNDIRLLHEESCRAVATADLQNLELRSCELPDGGAALVKSIRNGRGPRGLSIGRKSFDSAERFISFISALRINTYLERLDLSNIGSRDDVEAQALTTAVLENKGLIHFGLTGCGLDGHCWDELMAAISTHPSLRTLHFRDFVPSTGSTKHDRTKAVADMLLVNKHIDAIPFCCEVSFDLDGWNALVAPRVECNLYRKRFVAIQKIEALSTRAAILTRALVRVEEKPSLVWMVLSHNHDIICSYLLKEARDISASVPLRKLSRSPSADTMSAH
jgi:hypothetical protein